MLEQHEMIQQIRALIELDEIKEALSKLKKITEQNHKEYTNEVITLSARNNTYEKQKRLGIQSKEEEINQIRKAILDILTNIENSNKVEKKEDEIINTPSPDCTSETTKAPRNDSEIDKESESAKSNKEQATVSSSRTIKLVFSIFLLLLISTCYTYQYIDKGRISVHGKVRFLYPGEIYDKKLGEVSIFFDNNYLGKTDDNGIFNIHIPVKEPALDNPCRIWLKKDGFESKSIDGITKDTSNLRTYMYLEN